MGQRARLGREFACIHLVGCQVLAARLLNGRSWDDKLDISWAAYVAWEVSMERGFNLGFFAGRYLKKTRDAGFELRGTANL
jgi:hypothetical protein